MTYWGWIDRYGFLQDTIFLCLLPKILLYLYFSGLHFHLYVVLYVSQ